MKPRVTVAGILFAVLAQIIFFVAYYFLALGLSRVLGGDVLSKVIANFLIPSTGAALLAHLVVYGRTTPSWTWLVALFVESLLLAYSMMIAIFVAGCMISTRTCL